VAIPLVRIFVFTPVESDAVPAGALEPPADAPLRANALTGSATQTTTAIRANRVVLSNFMRIIFVAYGCLRGELTGSRLERYDPAGPIRPCGFLDPQVVPPPIARGRIDRSALTAPDFNQMR